MARPVKETPILFGKDARRFEERMKNPPKETSEQRDRRLKNYHIMMAALKAGEKDRREGKLPPCIIKIGHNA